MGLRIAAFVRRTLALCCLAATVPLLAQGTTGTGTNDVWFSPRTDGLTGAGTLADPFDGSNDKFHDWLTYWRHTVGRSGMTIHLLPGVYRSKGTSLPLNTRLVGSGMTNTVIRAGNITNSTYGEFKVLSADSASSYNAVSDVTLDANFGGTGVPAIGKAHVLWFDGVEEAYAERIRVIGYGSTTNNGGENFPVMYRVPAANNPGVFRFSDSVIEGAAIGGGYSSLLAIWSSTNNPSVMATNVSIKIYNNRFLNAPGSFAVNAGGANYEVVNNFFQNVDKSVYIDTDFCNGGVIRGNRAINVGAGVVLRAGSTQLSSYKGTSDWIIDNNLFELSSLPVGDMVNYPPAGVRIDGWATNIVITKNIIIPYKPYQGTAKTNWYGIYMAGLTDTNYNSIRGVQLIDNLIGKDLANTVVYGGTVGVGITTLVKGNVSKELGLPLDGFPDKTYIWNGSVSSDVVIQDEYIGSGLPQIHVGFSWVYTTNHGVVLPPPAKFKGVSFRLSVSKYSYQTMPVPLKISGASTSLTKFYDPASGGVYDTSGYPNMFYLADEQAFAYSVASIDLSGSANIRYASFQVYSDGYVWVIRKG